MKKIIAQYYLSTFILSFVLLSLYAFTTPSPHTVFNKIVIAFTGALALAASTGTLAYVYDNQWVPRQKKKYTSRPPFTTLMEQGFRQDADGLWKVVDGYTVCLSFMLYLGRPALLIDVLFQTRPSKNFLLPEDLNALRKRNRPGFFSNQPEYIWNWNCISCILSYRLRPPTTDHVLHKIKEMIQVLRREELLPIAREEVRRAV